MSRLVVGAAEILRRVAAWDQRRKRPTRRPRYRATKDEALVKACHRKASFLRAKARHEAEVQAWMAARAAERELRAAARDTAAVEAVWQHWQDQISRCRGCGEWAMPGPCPACAALVSPR